MRKPHPRTSDSPPQPHRRNISRATANIRATTIGHDTVSDQAHAAEPGVFMKQKHELLLLFLTQNELTVHDAADAVVNPVSN